MRRASAECLFVNCSKLTLSRYISHANCRLSEKMLLKTIPEAAKLKKMFWGKSQVELREMMEQHNRIIGRGKKMALLPICSTLEHLKFRSLDSYMLAMHGDMFVDLLLALASFGRKVIRAIEEDKQDGVWCVEMPFLITRQSWSILSRRVRILIRLIKGNMVFKESAFSSYHALKDAITEVSMVF
jgi:hypothetical protein